MGLSSCKAAILDMDGVITQTATVHARAWKTLFDEYLQKRESDTGELNEPFEMDRDYRTYVDGKTRYDGIEHFLLSRNIRIPLGNERDEPSEETICGLGNRKNEIFHELLKRDGVQVYEDTVEQIRQWKRDGIKLAVVSSSRNCEAVLRAAGLLDLFDAKVDGNDLARHGLKGKPAPDIFLHAAQLLGADPAEAIVVEDAIAGVQAGAAGGFGNVIGVARDRDATELQRSGADIVVHDLRELQSASFCPPGEDRLGTPRPAREQLSSIATRLRGKELALFLDYDGTLTPIVRRPEEATLSDEMRSLLSALAEHCVVTIISGRDRRDAEKMVQVANLVYAGSHGFDIHGPDGLELQHQDAQRALPDLDQAEQLLRQRTDRIDGARVERKKFALAVHYREVSSPDGIQKIEAAVDETLGVYPSLRKRGGKKIFELQPNVSWDKGRAVLWLIETLGLDHSGASVIYIGDDVTDEDAFRVLRQRETGIGIRVAEASAETAASYYLRDCDEVKAFLRSMLVVLQETRPAES